MYRYQCEWNAQVHRKSPLPHYPNEVMRCTLPTCLVCRRQWPGTKKRKKSLRSLRKSQFKSKIKQIHREILQTTEVTILMFPKYENVILFTCFIYFPCLPPISFILSFKIISVTLQISFCTVMLTHFHYFQHDHFSLP